jgi:hypothetical protein
MSTTPDLSDFDESDDGPAFEAVPTAYAGITFRSHLEAKWATLLDSWGIAWQYEPETITLPSGTAYIPDFLLPDLGTWIEVKGPGVPRIEKAIELGKTRACHCESNCSCEWPGGELVLIGHPPTPYDPWRDPQMYRAPWAVIANVVRRHGGHPAWGTATGRTAWLGRCPHCWRTGWFLSRFPIQCRACRKQPDSGHLFTSGDTSLTFPRGAGALAQPVPLDPIRDAETAERLRALNEGHEPEDPEPW